MLQSAGHVATSPLDVRTRNGALDIAADASVTEVSIEASVRCGGQTQAEADERLAATTLEVLRGDGNVLVIQPIFPQPRRSADAASFVVRLPDAQGIKLDTSNGAITVSGLGGSLVAATSNGRIEVRDHTGSARLDSSNGAIVVERHAGSLVVDTSNGAIRLTDIAGSVEADTSNGGIVVSMADGQTGPVHLDSSNGGIRLEVGPAYTGEVVMSTSNGSVNVDDAAGRISYTNIRRGSGTVRFQAQGPRSVIETSNSSVRLVVRENAGGG